MLCASLSTIWGRAKGIAWSIWKCHVYWMPTWWWRWFDVTMWYMWFISTYFLCWSWRRSTRRKWYDDRCRSTVFSALNSQLPTPTLDKRLRSNLSYLSSPLAGGFELNEAYVTETPLTQQARVFPQSRLSVIDFVVGPTGTGATTLRDKRRIRRQIHHWLWNNNRKWNI